MLRSMTKNHPLAIPKRAIMAWKFMPRSVFTETGLHCPQCGSSTFVLEGSALSACRRVCIEGEIVSTVDPDDVEMTLQDYDLYIPNELHCQQCRTITHFQ